MPVYERQRRGEPISSAVRDVPSGFGPFDFHKIVRAGAAPPLRDENGVAAWSTSVSQWCRDAR